MAKLSNRLTDTAVRQTKKAGWHADGDGLYLKVTPAGTKSYAFRYTLQGKPNFLGLGSIKTISLQEAREAAKAMRKLLLEGVDPAKAKREQRAHMTAIPTFSEAAARYIEAKKHEWTNQKHADTWESSLRMHMEPTIGMLRVDGIKTGDVVKALEKIWRTMPETASRTRQRVEKIFDWCQTSGYRTSENPARWKGHLENLLPKLSKVQAVVNQPALPWVRIPEFIKALDNQKGNAAQALKLLVLCAMRSGEVRQLKWSDIKDWLITIPADRMKASREHRIPLSKEAMALLAQVKRIKGEDLVFPGMKPGQPMSDATLLKVIKRMNEAGHNLVDPTGQPVVVHGFRSSFKTWATESSIFPRELVEMALAHAIGGKVEAAYLRGDALQKRRSLMQSWAAFATSKPTAGKVVRLGKAG